MPQGNNGEHDRLQPGRMSQFDKLPKALRVALANADHNWSGEQLLKARRSKRYEQVRTIPDAIAFIKQQDARKHREDAERGLVCPDQRVE
jgi:hypothetical protein